MLFFLYVKTHNKTGLKYLGQTIQDPLKYTGSGIRWLNHCRKHGFDISTKIIKICDTKIEIQKAGIELSNKWNVVESSEWANLKIEEGDGGFSHINNNLTQTQFRKEQFLKYYAQFKIERWCQECKTKFITTKCENKHFCSRSCSAIFYNRDRRAKPNTKCAFCQKPIHKQQHEMKLYKNSFCSKSHSTLFYKTTQVFFS